MYQENDQRRQQGWGDRALLPKNGDARFHGDWVLVSFNYLDFWAGVSEGVVGLRGGATGSSQQASIAAFVASALCDED